MIFVLIPLLAGAQDLHLIMTKHIYMQLPILWKTQSKVVISNIENIYYQARLKTAKSKRYLYKYIEENIQYSTFKEELFPYIDKKSSYVFDY